MFLHQWPIHTSCYGTYSIYMAAIYLHIIQMGVKLYLQNVWNMKNIHFCHIYMYHRKKFTKGKITLRSSFLFFIFTFCYTMSFYRQTMSLKLWKKLNYFLFQLMFNICSIDVVVSLKERGITYILASMTLMHNLVYDMYL